MADKGGALVFRQGDLTADALRPLLDEPLRRAEMGAATKSLAKPGATAAVIDWATSSRHA